MRYEEVLLHIYYEGIKKRCFADESAIQISNWVKSTIDADDTIPFDKKSEYYVSDRKISAFKQLLQEQTKEMTVQMMTPVAITPTTLPAVGEVKVQMNEAKVFAPILVKDAEKQAIDFMETFYNLFIMNQERMRDLLEKAAQFGVIDPGVDRSIKGYLAEMRQLLELFARITGREDFAKALGKAAGNQVAQTILPEHIQVKLKNYVRDLLAEIDPEQIPKKIAELERILHG